MAGPMNGLSPDTPAGRRPLIITADLGSTDLAWLDGQRRAHFPPQRNQLSAHLTMFHALPPFLEDEVRRFLKAVTAGPRPLATVVGLMSLGGGVAYRIASPALASIREEIAATFTVR